MESISNPATSSDRKSLFRTFMGAFNPTGRVADSVLRGLVETRAADLYLNLATRAELEPGSAQVVLGGIGSGKTTQLLLAAQKLAQTEAHRFFAEVSEFTDLTKAGAGTLVAVAADFLLRSDRNLLPSEVKRQLREFAHGQWIDADPSEHDEMDGFQFVRGKLSQPLPPTTREIEGILPSFNAALEVLDLSEPVFLFDGLDRIVDPDSFWGLVEPDLKLFRRMRVSVILVAPWALVFRADERLSETFDRVHELRVYAGSQREEMLRSILSARDKASLMTDEAAASICESSGGIIRDLISLARDAGEIAYLEGSSAISVDQAKEAAIGLGRSYAMGLDPSQIKRIRQIGQSSSLFSPSDPADLFLLLTRRVLHKSPGVYQVHPTLYPVPR